MSSASSNQSFVHDGASYEDLYPSGCRDLDEGSDDGDQGIKSVVGADGLREFVMLLE